MANADIQTLSDLVSYGYSGSYTMPTIEMLDKQDDIIYFDRLSYSKYDRLIMGMATDITLTDDEYRKYRFHPERLSYDVYGNVNLSHLILYINKCSDYSFNKYNIKLIPRANIEIVFQKIIANEQRRINKNHSKNS